MADFFCNADAAGGGDGSAPDTVNAWTTAELEAAWATVDGNNTVYLIGEHVTSGGTFIFSPTASGASKSAPLTIRGDYDTIDSAYASGSINASGTGDYCVYVNGNNGAQDFVTIKNIPLKNAEQNLGAITVLGNAANSQSNIVLDNLTVTNPQQHGIQFTVAAADNTGCEVKNCTVTTVNNSSACVRINHADGIHVHHNALTTTAASPTTNSHSGVHLKASASNNYIYNNDIGLSGNGFDACIHIEGDTANANNNRIYKNNLKTFTDGTGSECIFIRENAGGNKIYANTCTGGSICILDDSVAGSSAFNEIYGNLVKGYWTNGIDYRSDFDGYAILCNNTIIHNPGASAGHGLVIQSQVAATAKAWIYNNLLIAQGSGTNINGIQLASAKLADVLVDYNVYYSDGGGQIFGDLSGSDLSPDTLSAWQSALTSDLNVSVAEPNGVVTTTNPLNSDYSLPSGSDALEAGIKWWTGANPIGASGEPFSDFDTDIGASQSTFGPFHPVNL